MQNCPAKWEFLQGFDNQYMIGSTGQILQMNSVPPSLVNPEMQDGRLTVSLNGQELDVAGLVADYFLPNPMRYRHVMFKDGNAENCTVDNLMWMSYAPQPAAVKQEEQEISQPVSQPEKKSIKKSVPATEKKAKPVEEPPKTPRKLEYYQQRAMEEPEKVNHIKVLQCNADGDVIKEWNCLKDASERLRIPYLGIMDNLNRENGFVAGCLWRTVETKMLSNKNDMPAEEKPKKKRVKVTEYGIWQYSKNGEYIKTWENTDDIIKKLEIPFSALYAALRGERYTAGGFRWIIADSTSPSKTLPPIERKSPWANRNTGNRYQGLPILCYHRDGTFLKEFPTLRSASLETEETIDAIRRVCQGKQNSTRKYRWAYKETEDFPKKLPPLEPVLKDGMRGVKQPVFQFTLGGKFIKEWPSVGEAQNTLSKFGIGECCRGKKPHVGGFKWYYKGDDLPEEVLEELARNGVVNCMPNTL